MQIPTRPNIERLLAETSGPYISAYVPTHRRGAETLQGPIRLKNLIREAERQLEARGSSAAQTAHLVQPLGELVNNFDFWQHQKDGLILFRNAEMFEQYQADFAVPELAVVAERPHLKPMLAAIAGESRFYVLALSQNHARLLEGTRDQLEEREVPGMPASLDDLPRGQVEGRALQAHTAAATASGGRTAIFHGQYAPEELARERILSYFRAVDHAVRGFASAPTAPLILATVDYLAAMYRKVNSHAGLQQKWVSGNPDSLSASVLHGRVLPAALECFETSRRHAADRYMEAWHTQRASNKLSDVLRAALNGRVDVLFAAVGVQNWGVYNPVTGEVVDTGQQAAGAQDLLNLAAIHTYLNRGAVYAVPPPEVPGGGSVAAVYRY